MNTNVEALKNLYVALGGEEADVEGFSLSIDVLNAIAAMFDGEGDAALNPDAINNIAEVADNIGGGSKPVGIALAPVNIKNSTTFKLYVEGYNVTTLDSGATSLCMEQVDVNASRTVSVRTLPNPSGNAYGALLVHSTDSSITSKLVLTPSDGSYITDSADTLMGSRYILVSSDTNTPPTITITYQQ